MEKMITENVKTLTEEQEKAIKLLAELPEDARKHLLSYGAGMLAMKKAG